MRACQKQLPCKIAVEKHVEKQSAGEEEEEEEEEEEGLLVCNSELRSNGCLFVESHQVPVSPKLKRYN
jgi:hypothetical protein